MPRHLIAMAWLFHPLLLLIANSTRSELAGQIEFLKAENAILRARLGRQVRLTGAEKQLLVRLGTAVGKGIKAVLTVVSYKTFRVWIRQFDPATAAVPARGKGGRPRVRQDVRDLVLRLARENAGWGYTRILGEIRKLRITGICRSTVVNILRENGLDPKTDATHGTWADFLKAHAVGLWQCDFFSKHVITPDGVRQCFVLAFLHVQSRRVYLSPCTFNPNPAWTAQQAERFVADAKEKDLPVAMVLRDRDSNYGHGFDGVLGQSGAEARVLPVRSPNTNAYVERFVQTVQQECLDQFIAFGIEHLDLLCREYAKHYHYERPHQGLGNRVPLGDLNESPTTGSIRCHERLGGVLKHYFREAA